MATYIYTSGRISCGNWNTFLGKFSMRYWGLCGNLLKKRQRKLLHYYICLLTLILSCYSKLLSTIFRNYYILATKNHHFLFCSMLPSNTWSFNSHVLHYVILHRMLLGNSVINYIVNEPQQEAINDSNLQKGSGWKIGRVKLLEWGYYDKKAVSTESIHLLESIYFQIPTPPFPMM